MIWVKNYFSYAGMIRIPVGDIYHYAIYISDDEIIQFGEPPRLENKIPDSAVRVCVTTLSLFSLNADYVEGAKFDEKEQQARLSPEESVRRARSLVGTDGYSFLFNNCEHFVYKCVFGKPYSSQTEELRKRFSDIPVVDVYIAKIPENISYEPIYPKERYDEICGVSNDLVRAEKYYAWKLLRIAIERSLGYDFEKISFNKLENGKWVSNRCEFSISHSSGFVAVAVSKKKIGIDIEAINKLNDTRLSKRILSNEEYNYFTSLSDVDGIEYLIKMWTAKEAFYKFNSTGAFSPSGIELKKDILYSERIMLQDTDFYLSVVNDDIEKVRIFKDIKI